MKATIGILLIICYLAFPLNVNARGIWTLYSNIDHVDTITTEGDIISAACCLVVSLF